MPPPYHHHPYSTTTGAASNPYSTARPSSTNFPATATPSMNMNMTMHTQGGYTSNSIPSSGYSSGSAASANHMSPAKTRQYSQLQASLAQLNANLSDTQNLVRMTAVQAQDMRFLGGYVGALFMGSAKVLGEEGVKGENLGEVGDGSRVKREGS